MTNGFIHHTNGTITDGLGNVVHAQMYAQISSEKSADEIIKEFEKKGKEEQEKIEKEKKEKKEKEEKEKKESGEK